MLTLSKPAHVELTSRLNRSSVKKHFDAYEDVDWDAPQNRIEHDDPRFERPSDYGLGATDWYQSLPQHLRAKLGLHMAMQQMRLGIEFESILMRGLLEFATTQEPGSPELRYAYHEVIEESQHSLMFQEMIARAALPVRGLTGLDRMGGRRVPKWGRTYPELFFVHVLGGEAPIDHSQRSDLASGRELHPLLRRILSIHVTEEARHIAFARSFLRDRVPRASWYRRWSLRIHAPITLSVMSREMLEPPRWLMDAYGVPRDVRRRAFREDPVHRARLAEGVRSLRDLCAEIGLVPPAMIPIWRALGIWAPRLGSGQAPPSLPAGEPVSSMR